MKTYNIFQLSKRRILLLLSTCAAFAFLIWVLNNSSSLENFWGDFYAEESMKNFFCEHTFWNKVVRQPINTFSNFIYFMVGVAILRRGWKDQRIQKRYNLVSANPFYSITFGVIMLYIFCASTFFHASLINVASKIDYSSVYSLSLFPLMYYSHRVWLLLEGVDSHAKHPRSTRTLIIIFTMLYVILIFFIPDGTGKYVVLGLILFLIVSGVIIEIKDSGRTNKRYLSISTICVSIAVIFFAMDVYKLLCNPESILQPHSLWHFFAGSASFYFYMYIRSEKPAAGHVY